MRVGWARPDCKPDVELGTDALAFVFDGYRDKSMIFTLNGEILITNKGSELCFADFETEDGFIPVCSLGLAQVGRINLGKDASSFRYYTMCGLQEGFEPFAVNMNRQVTMWFSKRLPTFVNVPKDHSHVTITRIDGTVDSPPCLKVTHKTFGTQNSNTDMVFCRLSMPVEFHAVFKASAVADMNGVHEEESLKVKHRYPLRAVKHSDEARRVDYSSITTYYHSVRVFAGQDPAGVWVGWVTPDYHYFSNNYNLSKNRTVTVTLGDERGRVHETVRRSNCYMVWAGEVTGGSHSSSGSNVDLEVGCLIDMATGLLAFTVNGKEIATSYQVEPNTKLFPAVFVRPTSPNLFQFELTKIKNTMPLSSAIFKSEHRNPVPQCPPRLDVQMISAVLWSRMPNSFLRVETGRSQLLYIIDNQYLAGVLREGFYSVLISIHLETAKEARLTMNNEFIIPVTAETRSIRLFSDGGRRQHLPPGVGLSTSLKPRLNFAPPCFVGGKREQHLYSPQIPLDTLKEKAIGMLTEAVQGGGHHIRDPHPADHGRLGSADVHKILLLIDPGVFGEAGAERDAAPAAAAAAEGVAAATAVAAPAEATEKEGLNGAEEKSVEAGEEEAAKDGRQPMKGLLEKRLPEPVKRQICELLHYFCDCELKHRIEAIASFSDNFVSKLQFNQKFRYNELMLALNMSAAVTAKKTKEFRSPPQEQVRTSEGSTAFIPFVPFVRSAGDVQAPSNLKELISQTMVCWAQECQIQDPELVRKMFSLLRRQYDSIGELLCAMRKSYTISGVSVQDTINLLASLGQIRSLLSVRMGKEEEKLMIDGLGDIMNNKVFYQHPNLMRVLGMHETVMQVMVNVLGGDKSQVAPPPGSLPHTL
ncbi:hypothetical protein CRUP_013379 [Coryphaenoides rupestris]|nr:hypothetical protein CRUP_013379 [Coryphaenoides rupestris]